MERDKSIDLIPIIVASGLLLAAKRIFSRNKISKNQQASPVESLSFNLLWPINEKEIKRVGQSVMVDRDGTGRSHKGVDIFAKSQTRVQAASPGRVIRVIDGRSSDSESKRKAGLWIDIVSTNDVSRNVYRYLHLGEAFVKAGDQVEQGAILGTIANPNTSGLSNEPHLHFEIRRTDYTNLRQDYGEPIDPLTQLPHLRKNT